MDERRNLCFSMTTQSNVEKNNTVVYSPSKWRHRRKPIVCVANHIILVNL